MVDIISPKGNIGRNESIIGTLPSCITSPSLNIPIFLPLFTLRSKNRSSVLCEVFDKHMTEEVRKTSVTHVSSPNFHGGIHPPFSVPTKPLKIFFYEWSNTNMMPLIFHEMRHFKSWCERNKVVLTKGEEDCISVMGESHITCEPKKTVIMIANTQWRLQQMVNEKERRLQQSYWR